MRLLTFAPSHFSEKARWALDRTGTPYREQRITPGLHRLLLRLLGAGHSVPALTLSSRVLKDSTSILHFADGLLPAEKRLYPEGTDLRQQVEDYEQRVGRELGLSVPRWAYYYLLPRKDLMLQLFLPGVDRFQGRLFRMLYPLVATLMRRGLGIHQAATIRVRDRIDAHFQEAAEQLQGKAYLFGDRFSAADLSLAALAAPLLGISGYGGTLVPIEKLPQEARQTVERWRRHPLAAYVERIYRDHRIA